MNWNTGILEQLERSSFSEASQVLRCLFSPRPSRGMFSSLRPFCDGPSPRWPQPFARSFDRRVFPSPCVSLRLIPPSSPVISRYHPLSHVISPNRIQSHRIALLGWQKDLTLQHEHDSWVGPPPDWPRQTPASPAESKSPRSLTY